MYKLKVKASKNYVVTISNNLDSFSESVIKLLAGDKVAIVTDTTVDSLYNGVLDKYLNKKQVFKYVIKSGEASKNKDNYFDLITKLISDGFTRKDSIIAFGGGVVGDLTGFVASTFMRGITLIQVPTTILSAVDSSVGGKTAINLSEGKNLIGTFYQPSAVYINTEFFSSLPNREKLSGFGEIIKYAFLDKSIDKSLILDETNEKLIYKCLKIKRNVVSKDEKESWLRALLNLGHTVGHAIESLSNYQISHGECVVKGLYYSLKLSKKIYNISDEKFNEMINLLSCYGHDYTSNYSLESIVKKISFDKKCDGKLVSFVTVKSVGKPQIIKIKHEELMELLK